MSAHSSTAPARMTREEPRDHEEIKGSGGGFRLWLEAGNDQIPPPDVLVVTSGRRRIPAHSTVLASASPVLESMLNESRRKAGGRRSATAISILGVPCDAVKAFICLLYSSRCSSSWEEEEEVMGEHGLHLLALSHAYGVGWMKRACERGLSLRLTAEVVVDLLVLARRCDAPRLHLRCMQLLAKDFAAVKRTEAWRFLQDHDPWLELDILQFLQDAHLRRRRQGRRKAERRLYTELQEAMECLRHICTEGCQEVGPSRGEAAAGLRAAACPNPATCRGLRQLIHHFAACRREKRPGCQRCKRLWQLLRLHASICDEIDNGACKVPLCMQFKQRMQRREAEEEEEDDGDDEEDRWELLVKKVVSARVMSHLAKKQTQHLHQKSQENLMTRCSVPCIVI